MHLLGEGNGGVVVRDLAKGRAVGRRESNAVVHVEYARGAARRPDDGSGGDQILLGVDVAIGPETATDDGGLGGGLFFGFVC